MRLPDQDELVEAAIAKILAQPVGRRIETFAAVMIGLLDSLAGRYPRSTPRELTLMARGIAHRVLDRLESRR